jgi:hypothetical protein
MWSSEALLTAIHTASPRDCITEMRMAELTGRDAASITNSCTILRKHGLIVKTAQGCHKLTDAGRAAIAEGRTIRRGGKGQKHTGRRYKPDTTREAAWLAMRILGRFSVADLVMRAARGGEKSIESNLRDYCRQLCLAGYLRVLPTREPGKTRKGFQRYLLIEGMNTGPKPPVYRATAGSVYDPNNETEQPIKEAA